MDEGERGEEEPAAAGVGMTHGCVALADTGERVVVLVLGEDEAVPLERVVERPGKEDGGVDEEHREDREDEVAALDHDLAQLLVEEDLVDAPDLGEEGAEGEDKSERVHPQAEHARDVEVGLGRVCGVVELHVRVDVRVEVDVVRGHDGEVVAGEADDVVVGALVVHVDGDDGEGRDHAADADGDEELGLGVPDDLGVALVDGPAHEDGAEADGNDGEDIAEQLHGAARELLVVCRDVDVGGGLGRAAGVLKLLRHSPLFVDLPQALAVGGGGVVRAHQVQRGGRGGVGLGDDEVAEHVVGGVDFAVAYFVELDVPRGRVEVGGLALRVDLGAEVVRDGALVRHEAGQDAGGDDAVELVRADVADEAVARHEGGCEGGLVFGGDLPVVGVVRVEGVAGHRRLELGNHGGPRLVAVDGAGREDAHAAVGRLLGLGGERVEVAGAGGVAEHPHLSFAHHADLRGVLGDLGEALAEGDGHDDVHLGLEHVVEGLFDPRRVALVVRVRLDRDALHGTVLHERLLVRLPVPVVDVDHGGVLVLEALPVLDDRVRDGIVGGYRAHESRVLEDVVELGRSCPVRNHRHVVCPGDDGGGYGGRTAGRADHDVRARSHVVVRT